MCTGHLWRWPQAPRIEPSSKFSDSFDFRLFLSKIYKTKYFIDLVNEGIKVNKNKTLQTMLLFMYDILPLRYNKNA